MIDFVSDRRAPTPTAAAELATPVRADLVLGLANFERRLLQCGGAMITTRRDRLAAAGAALPRPTDVLAIASQGLDLAAARLSAGLERNVAAHGDRLVRASASFKPGLLERPAEVKTQRLAAAAARLRPAVSRRLAWAEAGLQAVEKLRVSFDPDGPLARGFARVHHGNGRLVRRSSALAVGEMVRIVFADGARAAAIEGAGSRPSRRNGAKPAGRDQGDLF